MGALLRDTAFYSSAYVSKHIQDSRKHTAKPVGLPFELTVPSPSAGGDTYNLQVIPAQWRVVGLECSTDGLGASAGSGRTFQIGDAGDDDRYMIASDFDLANAQGTLAFTGAGYTPSADTIVVGKMHATNPAVVGKKVTGVIWCLPFSS